MPKLGINIDHVATLREARGGLEPDPVPCALLCEKAGCDSIVAHLREDRRHINDKDVWALKRCIKTRFNLEMSINPDIVKIASRLKPDQVTLVPEKRQELTTEGGLCVTKYSKKIEKVIELLDKSNIEVSLFLDPNEIEIRCAWDIGIYIIEIHTGGYSLAKTSSSVKREFNRIQKAISYALCLGFTVNVGHGLNYNNIGRIARIEGINEFNIGHSIISRSLYTGIYKAVRDMKALIK